MKPPIINRLSRSLAMATLAALAIGASSFVYGQLAPIPARAQAAKPAVKPAAMQSQIVPDQTANTALLVMDVQSYLVDKLSDKDAYLARVRAAVEAAHRRKIPLIYVVVGFREGAPEANERLKEMATHLVDPQPIFKPTSEDFVVVKRRTSAFTGSDLEVLLRAQNIRHLVLAGVATSGVVLSTLREAADKDFQITVLSDACGDTDAEIQRVLTEKVFPQHATVTTVKAWAQAQ